MVFKMRPNARTRKGTSERTNKHTKTTPDHTKMISHIKLSGRKCSRKGVVKVK